MSAVDTQRKNKNDVKEVLKTAKKKDSRPLGGNEAETLKREEKTFSWGEGMRTTMWWRCT